MYNVVISFSRTKCVAFGNSHDKLWSSQWNITEKKIKAQDDLSVCPRVESIRMNKRHVAELVIQKSLLLNFWIDLRL